MRRLERTMNLYAIGLCIDEAYLLPALVAITSLADTLRPRERRNVAIRILTKDLTQPHAESMEAFARWIGFPSFDIAWCQPPVGFRIIEGSYITTTTYLRFHFTPKFVDRPYLIYLDADVLVLDDIATPLSRIKDGQLGAVRDELNYTVGECPALPGLVDRWPKLFGRPYYNAGALWLFTHLMPTIRTGVAEAMLRGREFIHHNDQDALNLWLLSSPPATPIAGMYNVFELDRFLESGDWVRRVVHWDLRPSGVSLLHFVGPMKPWLRSCPRTEGVKVYTSYLRQAAWLVRRLGDWSIG